MNMATNYFITLYLNDSTELSFFCRVGKTTRVMSQAASGKDKCQGEEEERTGAAGVSSKKHDVSSGGNLGSYFPPEGSKGAVASNIPP